MKQPNGIPTPDSQPTPQPDRSSAKDFQPETPQAGACRFVDLGAAAQGGGMKILLCDPDEALEANPKALFLGPKAENADLVERLILDVFRDYGYWRRNFHPEDLSVVQPQDQDHRSFSLFWAHFRRELQILLGELKADVPVFSPRYIGHMVADTCLPAVVAYLATMLYNPNNCSWEAAPVTTLLEVQVGRDLAKMVGFGNSPDELDRTWGHITSGGTLANLESIWVAKAVKFLPIAVRFAAREAGLDDISAGPQGRPLSRMNAWDLSNLSPSEALDLKDAFIAKYVETHGKSDPYAATAAAERTLKAHDILSLGDHAFFSRLKGDDCLNTPVIVTPQTLHYSWPKGAGALGVGSGQIVVVPVDHDFRMNPYALKEELEKALRERRPVIEVVSVAGTTEEGSVDPIDVIAQIRDEMAVRGLAFSLHCDAAYGGYFAACFRAGTGEYRSLADMQAEYDNWPAPEVYHSFRALTHVDSITIDPHKLGYIPYPAGAVVFRDARSKELVAQQAPYALGGSGPKTAAELSIGKYILEGSKPGAAVAAVFLCHRVVPLDQRGYGKLLGQTVRAARSFHRRLVRFAEELKDSFRIHPLVFPDTNIINYLINPSQNRRLDTMNRFAHALYKELSIDTQSPVQTRSFIVSHTELRYAHYNPEVIRQVLSEHLGIDGHYFASHDEVSRHRADGIDGYDCEVVVFRATLMNPFVLEKAVAAKDYIDLFLEQLASLLQKAAGSRNQTAGSRDQ
ncbi:MAG: pyridoxal-dependent decarboxylase [Thermodesulfobacteriota bacterium]